jgi:hypothetical protein
VISCHDYHLLNWVDVRRDFHRITFLGGRYKPLLSMSLAAMAAGSRRSGCVSGAERHHRS